MKRFFSAIILGAVALCAMAWSQKGHDVVANIAQRHLTAAAADSVNSLFDGMSMVYWANWLDNASHNPDYSYSKGWHYKNIEAGVAYEDAPTVPGGDIVTALREQTAILADSVSSRSQKVLALKMIVHLVGDLHQPMHLGRKADLGGNKRQVRFFNDGTNLHSVWDGRLVNAAHSWTYTEWTEQLDRLNASRQAELTAGGFDDWAAQTHTIASRLYDAFPSGSRISYNQIAYWTPTIEQLLLKGGLRLAEVLNAVFDPAFSRSASDF